MKRIYLDHNATTPLDERVWQAMYDELPANPFSVHWYGREARNRLTKARRTIAKILGVAPNEILFTSGGTEALCTVMYGIGKGHLVTSNLEHAAVYETAHNLIKQGCTATFLECGPYGAPTPEHVEAAIRPNTRLIAVMAVNNETGVKSDIEGIAQVASYAGVPLLVDGVALLGKESFTIPSGVSAMAFSGHKFHAPKGVGFLVVRPHLKLRPLLTGGAQEGGRRGGTENLAGILGLTKAVELVEAELSHLEVERLCNRLEQGICTLYPDAQINGEGPRICNTTNIAFGELEAEDLMMNLDLAGVAVSHGSACSSGSLAPSRILLNMGYSKQRAAASLRFSLSRMTTEEEIDTCLEVLSKCLNTNNFGAEQACL